MNAQSPQLLYLSLGVIILLLGVIFFHSRECSDAPTSSPAAAPAATVPEVTSATSGKSLSELSSLVKHSNLTAWQFPHKSLCQHWAVVTTIFAPTVSILKQAHMSNWCMVIVADKKGPKTYTIPSKSNYIYLTVEMQTSLAASSHMLKHLPWNHFSRKNIGFLYAVMNNAQAVYDFDDDNCLLGKHHIALPSESSGMSAANTSSSGGESVYYVRRVKGSYNHSVFNPYPVFGGSGAGNGGNLWPRGYPLDLIKETYPGHSDVLETVKVPAASVGIVQYLANGDPDFDAIYRLTSPLPVDFPMRGFLPVLLPHHPRGSSSVMYSPYNAQTTLFLPQTFWSLLLPVTVHGRVSDIWRAYLTQRILAHLPVHLVFHSPIVLHMRNEHNYLSDFNAELPLYTQVDSLIRLLDAQECRGSLPGCMEDMYVMLYEHGILGKEDVVVLQAWLLDLLQARYAFPELRLQGHEEGVGYDLLSETAAPAEHGTGTSHPISHVDTILPAAPARSNGTSSRRQKRRR